MARSAVYRPAAYDAFRKSHEIEGSTAGEQTDYQVRVRAFYDYSFPDGRFYHLSDRWSPIALNPINRHGMTPVHTTNIVEVNLVIDGASRRYLAYDAHWDGTEVRLYYTDDLEGTWTEYSANPILGPGAGNTWRTPSVALVGGTLHMFLCHRAGGSIERWTSADGINFAEQEDVIAGLSGAAYHVPFIWLNPNDGEWYLYWRSSALDPDGLAIMARHEADITNLAGEADVVVTDGALYAAYPTVMYRDGKYWLLGERHSNGAPWNVVAFSSDLPTAGFTDCDDSPILVNDEACPVILLSPDGSKCYLFTNRDSANWYQDMREVYATSLRSHEVNLATNCRTDFGDIRFTEDDGETELDYWLEGKVDSDYADFWIKIPTIPADPGTVTIYMYYGKADATTTSDLDATDFLFSDHFPGVGLDGAKWDEASLGAATLAVASSILTLAHTAAINDKYAIKTKDLRQYKAVRYRARYPASEIARSIMGEGWMEGLTHATIPCYPDFTDNSALAGPWGVTIAATCYKDSGAPVTDDFLTAPDWNSFEVYEHIWRTGVLSIYKEDILIAEITSGVPTASLYWLFTTFTHPTIAPAAARQIDVDWVIIREYCYPESAHGDWGAEEAVIWPF